MNDQITYCDKCGCPSYLQPDTLFCDRCGLAFVAYGPQSVTFMSSSEPTFHYYSSYSLGDYQRLSLHSMYPQMLGPQQPSFLRSIGMGFLQGATSTFHRR